jgi:hypothetical protein
MIGAKLSLRIETNLSQPRNKSAQSHDETKPTSGGPTLYPVTCSPQARASASAFYLLQACLGLSFHPERPRVRFDHQHLPEYLARVQIRNLRLGDPVVDLSLERQQRDVGVNVLNKAGEVEVSVVP